MNTQVHKTMKKLLLSIAFISILGGNIYASPPTRAYSYSANNIIDPTQNNTNENALYSYLQTGVDTYAASSITGAAISSSASIPYVSLSLSNSIVNADISSSAAIAASKVAAGGGILPSGAIYFLLSGSCPTGTTDVTATYSNRFFKANATAGTLGGVVLTGTTDAHVITTAELPASGVTIPTNNSGASFGSTAIAMSNTAANTTVTSNNLGSGTGHTHTLSTATTLEPLSVTVIVCKVN